MNVFLDTNVVIDFITRDKKGFNDFDILVMTPAEFVNKAKE